MHSGNSLILIPPATFLGGEQCYYILVYPSRYIYYMQLALCLTFPQWTSYICSKKSSQNNEYMSLIRLCSLKEYVKI